MCLAKIFVGNWSDEPVFEDVAYMQLHPDRVEVEDLFGKGMTVPGAVIEVNFRASKVLLGRYESPKQPL